MIRLRGGMLLLVLLCCSSMSFGQADTATIIFQKLRSRLNAIHDYTADVKVKIDVSFMKIPPLAGKLYFKAPDKMKLERSGGISILPKNNSNLSLNSMLPTGNVTVIDAGRDVVGTTPVTILKVIPQDDLSNIVLTKIWVDPERNLALRTETTTRDNGTIKMDLAFANNIKWGLPDKITVHLDVKEYKLPKGVTMDYDAEQKANKANADKKNKKGRVEITYTNYQVNKGLSDKIFVEK